MARIWGALLNGVIRRPRTAALLSATALVALALPAINMHTALPGSNSLPQGMPIVKTYDRIQAAFPGGSQPAVVGVLAANVRRPQVQQTISELIVRAQRNPQFKQPITTQISKDHRTEAISIPLVGSGTDTRSDNALQALRTLVNRTVGAAPGVTAGVTGATAGTDDFNAVMDSHLPIVFAFVLAMAFLLMLITFRSIVIPVQAILLNLLSVGAAYGVLVLVFQDGHLQSLLGFHGKIEITSWLPLFLFVVLFGLSMDYHVFILSRVKEEFDHGHSATEATRRGVKSTAGVVTSAAAVMVAVFSIFATLRMVEFKQMGVGLAVAILIDATVIRGILLPATLALLGDRAWYLPRWLQRLPGGSPRASTKRLRRSADRVPELV